MAVMLTDLADVLRKAGLEVVEIPGWKTRGRPGDFNPKGVLCHHTAGPNDGYDDAYYMAVVGRPDLSAPLAQLALSRKGVFYVLAAGRANHAGRCKAIGGLTPYPGESYGDGNAQLLGIEAQNRGTDAEDWSPAQYGAYVKGVAALCEHYGWSIVFGHKETSTSGKVDPDFPMDKFRRDVAANATQEDDMPTPEDLWRWDGIPSPDRDETNPNWQPDSYLRETFRLLRTVRAEVGALSGVVTALASGQKLTAEEITAAAKAGATAALDEKISDATTVLGVKVEGLTP